MADGVAGVGAVVAALAGLGWLWPILIVGAILLPYVAVVFANATGKRRIDTMGAVTPPPVPHKEIHGSAREPR